MDGGRQEMVSAEESQYRLLFEASPLPTWLADEDTGRFMLVNAAAVVRYGYSRHELGGMTVDALRLPFEGGRERHELLVRPRTPFVLAAPCRLRRKDGRVDEVELRATRLRFGGRPALLTVVLDAERAQAGEAPGWSAAPGEDARPAPLVGSWTWTALADGVVWSPELRRIYGVEAGTPASRRAFLALVHPDDRLRLVQRIADAMERRERHFDIEYRIVRPDGVQRTLHARHVAGYDLLGVPLHREGTVRDVTDVIRTADVA